ncbi:putative transcription factor WD40-like family [Helianthus anomalus]
MELMSQMIMAKFQTFWIQIRKTNLWTKLTILAKPQGRKCHFTHFSMNSYCVSINSSNTRMFVSGSCDATARLWDTRVASRTVRTFHGHEGDVNSVKLFPDGNRFGTGSDDGTSEPDTSYKFTPHHNRSNVARVLRHLW